MNNIVENQKTEAAVEAGIAFRYAYDRAKFWKAIVWLIALLLAIIQTVVSVWMVSGLQLSFDASYITVFPLLAFVFISAIGKNLICKWQLKGCTIQRLHDYLTMGVGVRPSPMELHKSEVLNFIIKRGEKSKKDRESLKTWWSLSLGDIPYPVAKLIANYSTFAWETELRRKYHKFLFYLLILFTLSPFVIGLILDYTLIDSIVILFSPFTPIIAVIWDEYIVNRNNIEIAQGLKVNCCQTWENLLSGKLSSHELDNLSEQHISYWQNFRKSATPIFEFVYFYFRKVMDQDMLIDTDDLISQFNGCKGVYNDE